MERDLCALNRYMSLAEKASYFATCERRKVGAVIVVDRIVISAGYNGPPHKVSPCKKDGCLRDFYNIPSGQRSEVCRALHAEQMALLKAGQKAENGHIFITHSPCVFCAKMIIASDIQKVYYTRLYPDFLAFDLLKEAGVGVFQIR